MMNLNALKNNEIKHKKGYPELFELVQFKSAYTRSLSKNTECNLEM